MSTKKTIAKSFTVSTIEDGVSVQAQYAPNANPSSGQIHTVWQEGDLYMRTRESDDVAWSSWHKIVGESGDETDFSFGISQYKTTANASTAPSDISSWSDAPLAVTTAKPYLWAKVQQKSWNASTQAYVVDSTRYIRLTGEDGYTVQAQYAPNNNPTSSQIHTTWQDGDLYMRTKQSNETTWSSWHKIVGESGDETDYTFALSAYKVSQDGTSSTAPSDIAANAWQDAPMATTSQKPYLWSKVQKKDGAGNNIGNPSYIRFTGEDAHEINPNILLRTVFEQGLDRIKEKWSSANWNAVTIDTASDTQYIQGRQSIRINTSAIENNTSFTQSVLGKLKPNTTYTFSFYCFASRRFVFYINNVIDGYRTNIYENNKVIRDGQEYNVSDDGHNDVSFSSGWSQTYHTITFTTNTNVSDERLEVGFYLPYESNMGIQVLVLCMPKLEIGEAATAYMAHEDDLHGISITSADVMFGLSTSETTAPSPDNTTTWKTSIAALSLTNSDKNKYIWQCTKITYSNGNTVYTGYTGKMCLGIVSSFANIVEQYALGTASAATGTWQDTTPPAMANGYYLWTRTKLVYSDNSVSYAPSANGYCVGYYGIDGTSPYFADLDNEMDSIACTHDGKASYAQTVSTKISMFKGSSAEAFTVDKIYRNGTQMSWDGNNNGVWPRHSGGTVTLEFDSGAAVNIKDDFKITLYATNATSVTRELHFTINGVRANAIYRLVPSHSQIVNKKDGTYVPSGNVTCSIEKTENGSTSTPNASEYTLEKSVNGGSYTTYSATAASSITSDLKFRLTVGGVVVDLETIPLVSDGNKGDTGDSAPAAFANPAQISIPCYSNGNVKAQKVTSVTFSLKVGTNSGTVTGVSSGTKPTGVTVTGVADNAVTITVGTSATASGLASGVTFTVTGTYGGKTYSATVTVALIGATQGESITGPRGKIGRFFYYAQEWLNSSSVSYTVSDAEAPYFLYNNNYWVFNPTTNGTYTMSEMGTPSASSANWQIMTSDFKYIITEAIFGNYAHFGSAIISGDWMISANGTINGTAHTASSTITHYLIPSNGSSGTTTTAKPYTFFDASNPLGETSVLSSGSSVISMTSSETTHNIASVYLESGALYYISVTGYCANSSRPHYIRLINSSYGWVTPSTFNSTSSATSTFLVRVTTSGYYTLQMYASSSGYYAYTTAYSVQRYRYAPYYAVDLLGGVSYQKKIYASGGLRSPFTYMTRGGSFTTDFNDNVAVYSGSETSYSLPWDASQSGRKVVITNYYWNGNYSTSSGFAKITAPSGKYFYEDGITKSTLKLSREAVELLGYGDASNFYGWVVLKRIDLGTESRYGHHMKMLASGRVTGSSSGASVSYHSFDGTTMSVTRDGTGIYTLSWSNNDWYEDAGHVFVMVCGYGVIDGGSNPLYASVKSQTKTSITVQTADDDSRNDGAFNFFLMNFNDWIYL